jgi:hypothetical protein
MQLFERSEFCVFRVKEGNARVLAASKLFNRAARFFWFVFLTRQKNEQAWSTKQNKLEKKKRITRKPGQEDYTLSVRR